MSPFYERLPDVPASASTPRRRRSASWRSAASRSRRRSTAWRGPPRRAPRDAAPGAGDGRSRPQTGVRRRRSAGRAGDNAAGSEPMADRIVIDPVTRIEGHLRIEAQVDGGKVTRGLGVGHDVPGHGADPQGPRPARGLDLGPAHLRRLHHRPRPSPRCARSRTPWGSTIPPNARAHPQPDRGRPAHPRPRHPLLPPARARLGRRRVARCRRPRGDGRRSPSRISDWPNTAPTYFAGVQARVKTLVDSGQLGLFASGYWGHPAYRCRPRRTCWPSPTTSRRSSGSARSSRSTPSSAARTRTRRPTWSAAWRRPSTRTRPTAINPERIALMRRRITTMRNFVAAGLRPRRPGHRGLLPRVVAARRRPRQLPVLRRASRRQPTATSRRPVLPRGIIIGGDLATVHPSTSRRSPRRRPTPGTTTPTATRRAAPVATGETSPDYTGPKPPYECHQHRRKYSWLKAPRYDGAVMEVGPLARMLRRLRRRQHQRPPEPSTPC